MSFPIDPTAKVLADALARNDKLRGEVELLKRLMAIVVTDLAAMTHDPDGYALERLERLRAALHQSDDVERRDMWAGMEASLDDIQATILSLLSTSR